MAYFGESFINGPELVQLALEILNFDFEAEEKLVITRMKKLLEKYDNLDLSIDKEVFAAMLKEYQSKVDKKFLPAMYEKIDTLNNGNIQTYVDSLYATSNITSPKGLKRFLERDTTYNLIEDPAVSLSLRGSVCSMQPCAGCMLIVIFIRMPTLPCGLVSERLEDILLLMEPRMITTQP